MTTIAAAKTFWSLCDGDVSNLKLQKLIYLAHMLELGAGRGPLASREFEAWDYGPVEPDLYHKLKAYGSNTIPDIFGGTVYSESDQEFVSIKDVADQLGAVPAARLVSITHWDGGAWSRHYISGARGVKIPDVDILAEYNERVERSAKRAQNKAA